MPHESTEKSGPQLTKVTKDLLDEWECTRTVVGVVLDTTSLNTGAITAGCVSVQSALEKNLLWLACRHHIDEVILTNIWNSLDIEVSRGPDITLFMRFKENYEAIEYADVADLDIPEVHTSQYQESDSIVQLCKEALAMKKNINRGDYKEFIVLTLVYLQAGQNLFNHFQRPGALHTALWMPEYFIA